MYSVYAQLLSAALIIGYLYHKTKDKICLWGPSFVLFFLCGAKLTSMFSFDNPILDPLFVVVSCLIFFGIPVVWLGVEIEKRRTKKTGERVMDFGVLLTLSRENIIFWTIIVLINLIAFLLE